MKITQEQRDVLTDLKTMHDQMLVGGTSYGDPISTLRRAISEINKLRAELVRRGRLAVVK